MSRRFGTWESVEQAEMGFFRSPNMFHAYNYCDHNSKSVQWLYFAYPKIIPPPLRSDAHQQLARSQTQLKRTEYAFDNAIKTGRHADHRMRIFVCFRSDDFVIRPINCELCNNEYILDEPNTANECSY